MTDDAHWLSPQEQRSWRAFVRLNQKLTARLAGELQAQSKLSGADFAILVALTDESDGRLRFQELAKAIDWEQSRLSHQISRMTKRGLVAREECAEDGRGAFVAITAQGRATIEAAAPKHVATVRRLVVDALSPEEFQALGDLADRVLAHMEQGGDQASAPTG
ncbi:MarR family winged helix-turn-helix transcriptional regulator [Glycomyces sp. TRM65418]|uniref:MarR family winged helix-turn-helix transcriptional regulator n=1 Tax=Glycomyces sp. TRM65418 TaxID=2867006 RepID=UPI001CE5FCB2|nr:MarR family winged helix-turn-helix transcriptional regulator [Glycomyces sp. TRM65418]MCC3763385.1 MarR family winged helix-turn-helix transcriptional regulator [Glycomyces sp. TRM65418]QZD57376.1 MarR family winged helix-turn-helix transcriptional regulator [Glycomyces sp. TRM65418]